MNGRCPPSRAGTRGVRGAGAIPDVSHEDGFLLVNVTSFTQGISSIHLQRLAQRGMKIGDQFLPSKPLAVHPWNLFNPANPPSIVLFDDCRERSLHASDATDENALLKRGLIANPFGYRCCGVGKMRLCSS